MYQQGEETLQEVLWQTVQGVLYYRSQQVQGKQGDVIKIKYPECNLPVYS